MGAGETSRLMTVNGLRSVALEWGPPAGELVVMVHGFPDTPHSWGQLAERLASEGYWVVAPFLRGYAPSEAGPADTTSADLAADGAAYGPALGRQRVHLVGHDWGAELAYGAVGLHPERFLSLTAIGIPHRGALKPTLAMAWGVRHFIALTLPGAEGRFASDDFAMVEHLCRRWSPNWQPTADELAPVKECFRRPGVVHAALGYYRAASVRTPPFLRAAVQVPTLCLAGTGDPAVTVADFERTRAHFAAGLEVLAVPGGHFCHRESPEPVIDGLLRHLARTRQAST
jgi:pimeloyl-ACP methyl ester carboxylesterase